MKIISIIKKDFTTSFRDKIKLLCLVVAILMPLSYGFLYLWAFWNPYDNMKNVNVAVVNEDVGATYQNKHENFGDEIADELKDDDTLQWKFVDHNEAQSGLDNQKYFAIIRIPRDFSTTITSANSDNPQQAVIEWQTKDSNSYIFTSYFKNVASVLQKNIAENILPKFNDEINKKTTEMADSLDQASNGAQQLSSGLGQLETGSQTLSQNLGKASDGSKTLSDGLNTLSSSSADLTSGIAKAQNGATALNTGLSSANTGANSLSNGLATLQSGANSLANGTQQAYLGSQQLATGANQIYSQLYGMDQSLSPLYPTLNKMSSDIDTQNQTTSSTIPNYIGLAMNQKNQLIAGEKQISAGSQTLASNLSTINAGANSLATGITSARQGSDTLSNGISQLYSGSNDLTSGLSELYDGSAKFGQGVNQAYVGSSNLSNGLSQLSDGSKQLTDGTTKAKDGATTLENKLSDGAKDLKTQLSQEKIDQLTTIINEPVKFKNVSTDTVSSYGSGLSPYFISLALWMGALILTLLVPTRDPKLNINAVPKISMTAGKFFMLMIIGILQATTLTIAVVFGLGLAVKYLLPFWLFCIAISFCFISIMQFLSYCFGKIGELIGILVLMIQLTSSSGTFPVQSSARFFQFFSPLVPMNYSIRGLRLLISGGQTQTIMMQFAILIGMTLLFLLLKLLATKKTVSLSDIYPLIEL